jgi:hypothetical protein
MRLSTIPSQSLSMPSWPTGSVGSLVSKAHGLMSESWSLQSPPHTVQPSPSSSGQYEASLYPSRCANPSNSKLASSAPSSPPPPASMPELESEPPIVASPPPEPELESCAIELSAPGPPVSAAPPASNTLLGPPDPLPPLHAPSATTVVATAASTNERRAGLENRRIMANLWLRPGKSSPPR